jgi:multidrug efflux pump subunit AcrA (membrane-fusion protein)
MKTENKRELRNIAIRFGIAFLVAVIVLTFFSKTIDSFLLPEVSVMVTSAGTISREENTEVFPIYAENDTVYAPFTIPIEHVIAAYGDSIVPQSVIATVDVEKLQQAMQDLEIAVLQAQASLVQLEKSLSNFSGNSTDKKLLRNQLEQAQIRLERAEEIKSKAEAAVDENGNILAGVTGIVTEIKLTEGMVITEGTQLFQYSDAEGDFILKWEVPASKAVYFSPKNKANLSYELVNAETSKKEIKRFSSELSEMVYNYGKDTYTFSVPIPAEAKENITLRHKVKVSILASAVRYDAMIPKNTLYKDVSGSYIFVLSENPQTGERFARKSYVNIADEDSFYYALEEKYKYTVIVSSSKPISDGTRVRTK